MDQITIEPFQTPDFLLHNSTDEIHQRMLAGLPEDLDKSEGQFAYDFTRPTALEKAELVEFKMNEAIKLIFPQWAYGRWLDYHGELRSIHRKDATYAYGFVDVKGTPGLVIPAGFLFATPATEEMGSIEFATIEETGLAEDGRGRIPCRCCRPGITGNIGEDTVKLMVKPKAGISEITNPYKMTGGGGIEDDDSLRMRILEYDNGIGNSFVGNDGDYIRWAAEVPGVGAAFVVPEWNGPGTVKIIVTDSNGEPANDMILSRVEEYIVSPGNRESRLAPIGAGVTVVRPTPFTIAVCCSGMKAQPDFTLAQIRDSFLEKLKAYYIEAAKNQLVRYNLVYALLAHTNGVADFTDITLNGKRENIPFAKDQYPVTTEVLYGE